MEDTMLLRLVAWGAHNPHSVIKCCPKCTSNLVSSYGLAYNAHHRPKLYQDPKNSKTPSWYCYNCQLTIMQADQEASSAAESPPDEGGGNKNMSPTLKRASRAFEEEYIAWENKVNSEFVEFLAHIREWVSGKEGQLKEQQLDLCHRERSLQSNEDFFKERMSTLKKAEEEFQQKVERLNLQIQDRMQRLRSLEAQRKRASVSYVDTASQTDQSGGNGPMFNSQTTIDNNRSITNGGGGHGDGDYMYMGEATRRFEPSGSGGSQPPDVPVNIDTQQAVNDSGFNTPDPDEVSPKYTFNNATGSNVSRQPSQNRTTQPSTSSVNDSAMHYNGERAILVKSPPGLDAYTSRSESYRNAVTRSRSVPPEEQQESRDRSLSPVANRSRSVPPEHDPIKRVQATFSDNILDRPASFAEGQRSPEALRSRSGSFGAQSVNGHASRPAHKPLPARARFMRNPRSQSDHSPTGSSVHSRSLSAGNEPVREDFPKDEPLPNSVPDYNPETLPGNDSKRPALGSNSVTNLDDPRLRESILTKSKQSTSFNMSDAIARYRAKSENQLPHDLSGGSNTSSPHDGGATNWQSDSAVGYRSTSYSANGHPPPPFHDSNQYIAGNVPTSQSHMDLNQGNVVAPSVQDFGGKQGKSRIPGRRSDPPDFRSNRPTKLTPAYPNSDSNLLNADTKHDINSNTIRPSNNEYLTVKQSRLTSPKPILKNPLKPPGNDGRQDSYHNTYANSSYIQSRIQQPTTKTYRRYDAPPPVRRYPSDGENTRRLPSDGGNGETAGKDHGGSMKSSTSDLYNNHYNNNGYHGDSGSSSHGSSGQQPGHTYGPNGPINGIHSNTGSHVTQQPDVNSGTGNGNNEIPEMTSTPRDSPPNNPLADYQHAKSNAQYTTNATSKHYNNTQGGSNHASRADYKPMSSFKGSGTTGVPNTGGTSRLASPTQYRDSSSQLQHPIMAGKISLRDKSTWAIKKRREMGGTKPGDNVGTTERPSRRLQQPGVYPKTIKESGRARSDPRVDPQYDHQSSRISTHQQPPLSPTTHTSRAGNTAQHSPTHTSRIPHSPIPQHSNSPVTRRAHSSEGYLEPRKPYREHNGYHQPPPYRAPRPPSYPPRDVTDDVSQQRRHNDDVTPPRHTDNDVLERASDSDSELVAPKNSKKKGGFKSKLKGLYKNSSSRDKSSSAASSNKNLAAATESSRNATREYSTSGVVSNQQQGKQQQQTGQQQQNSSSPKTRRKLQKYDVNQGRIAGY